jgi:hypothetical protein
VGVSDLDSGIILEKGAKLPWASMSRASYMYYDCYVQLYLDSGMVVHRQLPQSNPAKNDTLGTVFIGDKDIDEIKDMGVNSVSKDTYTDTVQRMAHAVYRFALRGQALRVGYQIPIPCMKTVGGVPAIPDDSTPQTAFNRILGNYSGVALWHARWELWYTVAVPPKEDVLPPANLAAHIRGDQELPDNIQVPWTYPDVHAEPAIPGQLLNPI